MILTEGWIFFDVIASAFLIFAEAWFIKFRDLPAGPYGIFFSCCLMVLFSYRFFASLWILPYARIWNASKAAFDRLRSAGNKAWVYVLGIVRKV
jgi:hypothetical protein